MDNELLQRLTILDELYQKAEVATKQVDHMLQKVKDTTEEVVLFNRVQFKNKVFNLTLAALAFTLLLVGTSYFIYKKFPSSVWLNTYGDVHIDGGEVVICKTHAPNVAGNKSPKNN